jgi:hypothetical protein
MYGVYGWQENLRHRSRRFGPRTASHGTFGGSTCLEFFNQLQQANKEDTD